MNTNNIKNNQRDRGFTIVELLVVIVVIGILSAITIVSYTGVTNRANTASAQSSAKNVYSKTEIYYVDSGTNIYPDNLGKMTVTATSDKTYFLSGVTFSGTLLAAAPGTPSTINWFRCGTGAGNPAPANLGEITAVTGARIGYWNYATPAINYTDIGKVSGTVGTKSVACFITTVVGT